VNVILRGVRVIDPAARVDDIDRDVWIAQGRIIAIEPRIHTDGVRVVDLTPEPGLAPKVLCPGFIDVHAHLREPGGEEAETIATGALAAAAGGFTHVVAMANTTPAIDSPWRVEEARVRATEARVRILTASALTRELRGTDLVDIEGCTASGAVAFTDDGRNAAAADVLLEGLRRTAAVSRPVLLHPEDEAALAEIAGGRGSLVRFADRPSWAETRAIETALDALNRAGSGHLHLQHVTCEGSIELVRAAKDRGAGVTAEVTPHHLSLVAPDKDGPARLPLYKVNPPLRGERDRLALVDALRDGIIDCIATDHAPHPAREKALPYAEAAPGLIGLETAFAMCNSVGGLDEGWLRLLIERLTVGPHRVLAGTGLLAEPRLRVGEAASCVLLDPSSEWVVGEGPPRSRSRNTPLIGKRLRGRVLLTIAEGRIVHRDELAIALPELEPARG